MATAHISPESITINIRTSNNSSVSIVLVSPESSATLYFGSIIKDIGIDWPRLARTLGINEQEINAIRKNIPFDTDEQCTKMLHSYYRSSGKSFTKRKLVEALYSSDLRSVAETINHLHLSGSNNINNSSIVDINIPNLRQQINADQDIVDSGMGSINQGNNDITKCFYDVADKLQQDWIPLAEKLDSSKCINIAKIKEQYSHDFDRADAFLNEWNLKYANSGTRRLTSALKAINKSDIAAIIDKTSIRTSHNVATRSTADEVDASSYNTMQSSSITQLPGVTGERPRNLKYEHCKQSLKDNWERFIEIIPANDNHFLSNLKQKGTLSEHQIEEITPMKHKRDKTGKLHDIFINERDVEDFLILCEILINSSENSPRNLGYNLQNTAYNYARVNKI